LATAPRRGEVAAIEQIDRLADDSRSVRVVRVDLTVPAPKILDLRTETRHHGRP
jgi:hypothetical protein